MSVVSREAVRTTIGVVLVIVAYSVVPYGLHLSDGATWLRGSLLVGTVALLLVVVGRRVER